MIPSGAISSILPNQRESFASSDDVRSHVPSGIMCHCLKYYQTQESAFRQSVRSCRVDVEGSQNTHTFAILSDLSGDDLLTNI